MNINYQTLILKKNEILEELEKAKYNDIEDLVYRMQLTLKYILPDIVKVSVTIIDVRLKSNLKINQTLVFTEKSSFYTILGFTRSRSYPLDDIEGFYQLVAGSYKGHRPTTITRVDKNHLKCDCFDGSVLNGVRGPILYSFALSSPPGHKIYKEPRINFFKKVNKSVLSHITF